VALDPALESSSAPPAEANVPAVVVTTVSAEPASSAIEAPSSQRAKLSQWWEKNRDGILASVIKVFGVTAKVLELVPLAEQAAKAFEHAASVLEEVQVVFFGDYSRSVYTDKPVNPPAIVGECGCRP
jgi:hypothetical protein